MRCSCMTLLVLVRPSACCQVNRCLRSLPPRLYNAIVKAEPELQDDSWTTQGLTMWGDRETLKGLVLDVAFRRSSDPCMAERTICG